jgi:hypothetical protein
MCGGGGDVFSDIGGAIEDAVQSVGDIGEQIGEIGTSVAQQAQQVGQNIIDNPLPMIETLALTFVGVPEPVAAAAVAAINGGDVRQIAISAGTSYIGGQAGAYAGAAGADPVTARIIGGATGGATGATATGKSVFEGAVRGGISRGVGGLVSSSVGADPSFEGVQDYTGMDYLGEDQPLYYDQEGNALTAAQVAQLRPDLFPGGVPPEPGQQTRYDQGQVSYEAATPNYEKEGVLAKTLGTLAGRLTTGLLAPQADTPVSTRAYAPKAPATSTTSVGTRTGGGGGGSYRVGSGALGQALNVGSPSATPGSGGGYGMGGEEISKETGGKPQNVWNLESLRVKDETGSE